MSGRKAGKCSRRTRVDAPDLLTSRELRSMGYGYSRVTPGRCIYIWDFQVRFAKGVHGAKAVFTINKTLDSDVSCTLYAIVCGSKMAASIEGMRKGQMGVAWIQVVADKTWEEDGDDDSYESEDYGEEFNQWNGYDYDCEDNSYGSGEYDDDDNDDEEEEEDGGNISMKVILSPQRPNTPKGCKTLFLIKITDLKHDESYSSDSDQ